MFGKLIIILCLIVLDSQANGTRVLVENDDTEQKPNIELGVFFESLCSDSIAFFKDQLAPVYEKIGDHFYVDLVPFGHANITDAGMVCQHGPRECAGNRRMGCIVERTRDQSKVGQAIRTITCIMGKQLSPQRCAHEHLLEASPGDIERCRRSPQSLRYMKKYAEKTGRLDFVPHLTLQGEHTREIQDRCRHNLLACICDEIDAERRPAACREDDSY